MVDWLQFQPQDASALTWDQATRPLDHTLATKPLAWPQASSKSQANLHSVQSLSVILSLL